MATLARDTRNEELIQAASPTGTTQAITTSGSSSASSAFGANTRLVRIVATEDVNIQFASSPTATTSTPFVPKNSVEYFKVTGGEKIAVIQNSTAGTCYVTEME